MKKTILLIAEKGHDIADTGLRDKSSMERMSDTDTEIYSNLYKGKQKASNTVTGFWDSLINWFIKNL